MKKQKKILVIDELKKILNDFNILYITDTENLNGNITSQLRRSCFKENIKIRMVKNTLIKIAMTETYDKDYSKIYPSLKGNTTILVSNITNSPAKLIQSFKKKWNKPILKSAWIDHVSYVGDQHLDILTKLKSKDELIGEIINILQSPIKRVVFLNNTLLNILQTLSTKRI